MTTEEILSTLVIICIVLVIFYMATWQRRKQQKDLKKMQSELKKGDRIITFSGITGKVDSILDDRVIIEAYPDKVKLSVEKWAIAGLDDRKIE